MYLQIFQMTIILSIILNENEKVKVIFPVLNHEPHYEDT